MNRARIVTTRTGIVIGGAWTPPPQPLGSQAEIIQAVLLSPGQRRRSTLVLASMALRILIAAVVCRVLDTDFVAAYRRHRRMFFSRRESLLRALVVSLPFFR
jgi:hypothetical protein